MARKRERNSPEYREKVKEWSKARYARNKEKHLKQVMDYRESNREDVRYRLVRMRNAASTRAKNKGLDFEIDLEFLLALWEQQNGCCAISGRTFDLTVAEERVNKNAPSLDRIDPKKGYVKDNVRLVTWQINCALSEYGLESFLAICQDVIDFNKG